MIREINFLHFAMKSLYECCCFLLFFFEVEGRLRDSLLHSVMSLSPVPPTLTKTSSNSGTLHLFVTKLGW